MIDQSGALQFATANVFASDTEPQTVDAETRRSLQLLSEVGLHLRDKWMAGSYRAPVNVQGETTGQKGRPLERSNHAVKLVAGVVRVSGGTGGALQEPFSFADFVNDFLSLKDVVFSPAVQKVATRRLRWLLERFETYLALNSDLEQASLQSSDAHTNFHSVCKVDTHVHLTAAMSPEQLVNFMRDKINTSAGEVVAQKTAPDGSTKPVTRAAVTS